MGAGTSFGKEVVVHDQQVEVTDRGGRSFHFAIDPESGDSRLKWITRNNIDLIYLQSENDQLRAIKDAAGYTYRLLRDTTTVSSPSTATSWRKESPPAQLRLRCTQSPDRSP